MTLAQVNALSRDEFTEYFGRIYEHSPWVAEQVWPKRPYQSRDQLRDLMRSEVENAGRDRQLALLRAHPDLGTRAKIGDFSANEQKGVGLDQLTSDEYEMLLDLNRRYSEQFGFPFIFAVRGSDRQDIFHALMIRLDADAEEEFHQALWEVHRIAFFRLSDLIETQ
jgi:2-oxo-4-hydroxy-4-carboxy-5-ureidoimidazoline decarboxylase